MGDEEKAKAKALAFWKALRELESEHDVELGHEDGHGSFEIHTVYGTVGTVYEDEFQKVKKG